MIDEQSGILRFADSEHRSATGTRKRKKCPNVGRWTPKHAVRGGLNEGFVMIHLRKKKFGRNPCMGGIGWGSI
jgi:hypothetical protein